VAFATVYANMQKLSLCVCVCVGFGIALGRGLLVDILWTFPSLRSNRSVYACVFVSVCSRDIQEEQLREQATSVYI